MKSCASAVGCTPLLDCGVHLPHASAVCIIPSLIYEGNKVMSKFIRRFRLTAYLILPFVLSVFAQAQPNELSRDERWREDVRFYAAELPKRHKNLFFQLSKNDFEREVKRLEEHVPKMSDEEIYFALMRITAAVGDGHTGVGFYQLPTSRFPFRFSHFRDGWFVTRTTNEYRSALGAQLVKIGDVKIERAVQLLNDTVAADNEFNRTGRMSFFLNWAEALQTKGILKRKETGKFVFLDRNGRRFSLDVRPVIGDDWSKVEWREVLDKTNLPFALKNAEQYYWFEYLPEAKTLYLAYNQCANDPTKPFDDFIKEVFAVADAQGAQKFVIDLRRNGGGDSKVLRSLAVELERRPHLIEKGKLFALVSTATFSSAFMNAIKLREVFNALWVGMPPGERPNTYGEVQKFELPHSKIEVSYSTKMFEFVKDSKLSYVPVDIMVEPAFADYGQGRDAVLQAALNYKAK